MQKFIFAAVLCFGTFSVITYASIVQQSNKSPSSLSHKDKSPKNSRTEKQNHYEDLSFKTEINENLKHKEQDGYREGKANRDFEKTVEKKKRPIKDGNNLRFYLWNLFHLAPEAVDTSGEVLANKTLEAVIPEKENSDKENFTVVGVGKETSETEILEKHTSLTNSEEQEGNIDAVVVEKNSDGNVIETDSGNSNSTGGDQKQGTSGYTDSKEPIIENANQEEEIVRIVRDEDKNIRQKEVNNTNSEKEETPDPKSVSAESTIQEIKNTDNENPQNETEKIVIVNNGKAVALDSQYNGNITEANENCDTTEYLEMDNSENKSEENENSEIVGEGTGAESQHEIDDKQTGIETTKNWENKESEIENCWCALVNSSLLNLEQKCLHFCGHTKMENDSACELISSEDREPFCSFKSIDIVEESKINQACSTTKETLIISEPDKYNELDERRCYDYCPNYTKPMEFGCLYVDGITWTPSTFSGVTDYGHECRLVQKGTKTVYYPDGGCKSFCKSIDKTDTLSNYTCEERSQICNGWLPFYSKPCNFYCTVTTVNVMSSCFNEEKE